MSIRTRAPAPLKLLEEYPELNGNCAYCGRKLTQKNATVDHIKPISKGGDGKRENLIPVCKSCNLRKGNLSLEEFRIEMSIKDMSREERLLCKFGKSIPNEKKYIFYIEMIASSI